jgi:MinD-like ATPase involved in chromosome partitioning or flagellar assembly
MTDRTGEVITFYSYKGGVGRSMALANVATLLAHAGQRVLAIDFDLEAPGLHRYFGVGSEPSHTAAGGVVEFFTELRARFERFGPELGGSAAPFGSAPNADTEERLRASVEELIEQGAYYRKVTVANPNNPDRPAELTLMMSGHFDASYPERVRTFPWQSFYEAYPMFVELLAEQWTAHFDYILIDSRTGTTDVGNLCTVLLPEKLVLVCTPNEQALHGAIEVGRQAVQLRKASPDLRPLPLFPLISRIENAEDALQRKWITEARRRFEAVFREVYGMNKDLAVYFDTIQIPHKSFYAYGEVIAAERERITEARSLVAVYREFVEALRSNNAVDAQSAMRARLFNPTIQQQSAAAVDETTLSSHPDRERQARFSSQLDTSPPAVVRSESSAPTPASAPVPVRTRVVAMIVAAVAVGALGSALLATGITRQPASLVASEGPVPSARGTAEVMDEPDIAATGSNIVLPVVRVEPSSRPAADPLPRATAQPLRPKQGLPSPSPKPPSIPPTIDQALVGAILPRASSTMIAGQKTGSDNQVYRFEFWIEAAPEVLERIASVTYHFDHPSFQTKTFTSSKSPEFRQSYQGWGCLSDVAITVHLKTSGSLRMKFDQCAGL